MTVKGQNLNRLFRFKSERGDFFYRQWRLLNPLNLFTFLLLSSLIAAAFTRMGWVCFLSILSFLGYLYLRTSQIAYHLRAQRSAVPSTFRGETLKVLYHIRNESWFPLHFISAVDAFTGNREHFMSFGISENFETMKTKLIEIPWKANAGIGHQELGPCDFEIWDPLGIFCFKVTDEKIHKVEVFPIHRDLPQLPLSGSNNVFTYGEQLLPTVGNSTLFSGVREYRTGDNFRHIAWRMSAKHHRLMVKEFDRSVNSYITLLLDLCIDKQIQVRGESTWEFLKDLASNLAVEQASHSNHIQLKAGSCQIPFGLGPAHVDLIANSIARLKPHDTKEADQLEASMDSVPAGSTLFFLAPVFMGNFTQTSEMLLKLQARGVQIFCFLVEAGSFVDLNIMQATGVIPARSTRMRSLVGIDSLRKSGMRVFLLEKNSDIGKCLEPFALGEAA